MKKSSALSVSVAARGSVAPKPTQKQIVAAMALELAKENKAINEANKPKREALKTKWQAEAKKVMRASITKIASSDLTFREQGDGRIYTNIYFPGNAKLAELSKQIAALAEKQTHPEVLQETIRAKIESEMVNNLHAQLKQGGLMQDSLIALGLL